MKNPTDAAMHSSAKELSSAGAPASGPSNGLDYLHVPVRRSQPVSPLRWGPAARLFAILALLGAIAVLVTSVLGYLQARDALQEAIYNQLTFTRKSKVQQVETYFRTIRNELTQVAGSKEAIDAAQTFRATFNELNRSDVPVDLQRKV